MRDFVVSNRRIRGLGAVALALSFRCRRRWRSKPPNRTTIRSMPRRREDHSQHRMPPQDHSGHQPRRSTPKKTAPAKTENTREARWKHSGHPASHGATRHASPGKQAAHSGHGGGAHDEHGGMKGFLGPYSMTREGSGTSWVPDTTPHEGIYGKVGDWSTMWHGYLNLIYDHQGGPRGGDKTFANGMVMGMAQRPLGDGTLGVRAMLSPDPFMGKSGYPLLLASGETADGRTHLIDRQHPHDLFMELAGDLQPQPQRHVERVRLRRPARRAGARAAGLHAPHQRRGQSRKRRSPTTGSTPPTSPSAW